MIKVEEKRRRIEASFLDDLLKGVSKSMLHGLAERLERSARGVVDWSLSRLAACIIAIGIAIAAAILLLMAGVEGLKQASVSPPLAYLASGLTGLAAALMIFRFKG
jgi:hypothetical protein